MTDTVLVVLEQGAFWPITQRETASDDNPLVLVQRPGCSPNDLAGLVQHEFKRGPRFVRMVVACNDRRDPEASAARLMILREAISRGTPSIFKARAGSSVSRDLCDFAQRFNGRKQQRGELVEVIAGHQTAPVELVQ